MIRVLAIGVFRHGNRILVSEGIDPTTGKRFYRPLGGALEFGEWAADALRREIVEELDLAIEQPTLLGVLENHFTYDGRAGHEIVFAFDARFVDASAYERDELPFIEGTLRGTACWIDLNDLRSGSKPVYPDGLLDLLKSKG
jgi:ADP-ribose pyrophosphatase YjhB (NUDIX family)